MISHEEGRLFDYTHKAYAHGVNTGGMMGAGIAVEFKNRFPGLFKAYREQCESGQLSPGELFLFNAPNALVFNLATQRPTGRAQRSYLRKSAGLLYVAARSQGITDIHIPKIGCGLGGLEEEDLIDALNPFLNDSKHHIVIHSIDDISGR